MGYVYQDTVRGSPRNALDVPTSTQEVLREQFAMTFEENPIMAVKRWGELSTDYKTGPMLPADTARQKLKDAGLENDLKVSDAGITQAALDTLIFRKRIEKRRQEVFARSEGGLAEGAARLGLSLATTLSDPISMGLNFVPIVGQVRYARWLANAGSMAGRIGVRAGVGAVEGAAGAALAEPFIYGMRTQEQADYDTADSLLNVAFGGVVGSGLHTTVGSLGELIQRSRGATPQFERFKGLSQDDAVAVQNFLDRRGSMIPADIDRVLGTWTPQMRKAVEDVARIRAEPTIGEVVDRIRPEAQQAALRAAVGQAVEGRPISIEPIIQSSQIRQTETPEFRLWFGKSQIIDKGGSPKIMYHGTQRDFDAFDISAERNALKAGGDAGKTAQGFYFSDAPSVASAFSGGGGAIYPVYLRMENPYRTSDPVALITPQRRAELESIGHDGVIRQANGRMNEYIVFNPHQVKSAIGNSGRFDSSSVSLTDPIDPEYRAATEQAEVTLAREVENTTEANLKVAEEEADLAQAEATELAKRLGVDIKEDADMVAITEAADKAERWARAAELATVCLVRGG